MNKKSILVIKLKQIGDVLLSTPVLRALKEAWPEAEVTYLVPLGTEDMLRHHPLLTDLMVVNRRSKSWRENWHIIRELRRRRFDLVLELSGGDRGAFYTLLTGAAERLGFARSRQPLWQRHLAFTRLLPRPPVNMHLVEQNLAPLRALGITPTKPRLELFWTSKVEARVQQLITKHGLTPGQFVIMHPGAGWRFKCWSPQGYARVIEFLQQDWRLPVVLTASQAGHEQDLLAEILSECHTTPINLAGRLSLKELAALLAKARFFFGVDSAPMHLAAAVNTPAVALFGPTGAYNWAPWGHGHLVIQQDWDCVPCGRDGCEGSKISRCLTELSPTAVLAQLREFIPPERQP